MSGAQSILFAYGTCDEAIKLAPLVVDLRRSGRLEAMIGVPGQRSVVLDEFHAMLRLTPQIDLDAISGVPLEETLTRALAGQSACLERSASNLVGHGIGGVVVGGDAHIALAMALVAFRAAVPVVHVEAGSRATSGTLGREWTSSRVIAQVASLHLVSTNVERDHLLDEGISPDDVVVIGRLSGDDHTAVAGDATEGRRAIARARVAIERRCTVGVGSVLV